MREKGRRGPEGWSPSAERSGEAARLIYFRHEWQRIGSEYVKTESQYGNLYKNPHFVVENPVDVHHFSLASCTYEMLFCGNNFATELGTT